jgi:hypothetical protein
MELFGLLFRIPNFVWKGFTCSIANDGLAMRDPVFTHDGHTYDRPNIEDWLKTK